MFKSCPKRIRKKGEIKLLQQLQLQEKQKKIIKRRYEYDDQVNQLLKSVTGGKQKPVYFCENGKVWLTDITTGSSTVSGKGFYVPEFCWEIKTTDGELVLFPGFSAYGLMNESHHRLVEDLIAIGDKPDQFFLIEGGLSIIKSGTVQKEHLREIQSRCRGDRMPLYGLTNRELAFVVSRGEIITADNEDWPKHRAGFLCTIIDLFDREFLDLVKTMVEV